MVPDILLSMDKKKKEDTKEYIFITFALCALFCSNEEEDLY